MTSRLSTYVSVRSGRVTAVKTFPSWDAAAAWHGPLHNRGEKLAEALDPVTVGSRVTVNSDAFARVSA
jgi:hypothetical protein